MFEWPEWVPEKVRDEITDLYRNREFPTEYEANREKAQGPENGRVMDFHDSAVPGLYRVGATVGRKVGKGRYIYVMHNMGRIVTETGEVFAVFWFPKAHRPWEDCYVE